MGRLLYERLAAGLGSFRAAHTAYSLALFQVIASELLRERVGEYTCDGRLRVSEHRIA